MAEVIDAKVLAGTKEKTSVKVEMAFSVQSQNRIIL
jgi:hypothetical protein